MQHCKKTVLNKSGLKLATSINIVYSQTWILVLWNIAIHPVCIKNHMVSYKQLHVHIWHALPLNLSKSPWHLAASAYRSRWNWDIAPTYALYVPPAFLSLHWDPLNVSAQSQHT